MALDAWLPIEYVLPCGAMARGALFEGPGWQIVQTQGNGRALLAREELACRWIESGVLDAGALNPFEFGRLQLHSLSCGPGQVLCPVSEGRSPDTKSEALAFALALRLTREIDHESPLQDAIYVEKFSRLLPTYSISSKTGDDVVLGYWLTGGANISVKSFRRLRQAVNWMSAAHLREVVETSGFQVAEMVPSERRAVQVLPTANTEQTEERPQATDDRNTRRAFELPGRPHLESFVNEHIIDIVNHKDRYKALGIAFPSPVVLHGPPGCGKTYAIDRLIDFLGWPSYQVDASSVASPYIHETSRKVAQVFDRAIENAPSVLVIDEMEAFLTDRDMGSGHHRVEEVAEFLRRIPEASNNEVLIVAMTNRIDLIDPAILRRGRFDHVVEVGYASGSEVLSLLKHLFSSLPRREDIDADLLAKQLTGRPLSDVAFVVREGARLAARSGKDRLDMESLLAALNSAPARERGGGAQRRIGFI